MPYHGILAFNLRTENIHDYNSVIKKLKKNYKVITIFIRQCSAFVICSKCENIKIEKDYQPSKSPKFLDFIISNIEKEINSRTNKEK